LDGSELALIDKYFGKIVEYIVYKFGYNIDLEEEYDELLQFIYKRIVKVWFDGKPPSLDDLEAKLKSMRRKRSKLEVVLSYLISIYAKRNGTIYLKKYGDRYDERYYW